VILNGFRGHFIEFLEIYTFRKTISWSFEMKKENASTTLNEIAEILAAGIIRMKKKGKLK
jgi:hypothetical protein